MTGTAQGFTVGCRNFPARFAPARALSSAFIHLARARGYGSSAPLTLIDTQFLIERSVKDLLSYLPDRLTFVHYLDGVRARSPTLITEDSDRQTLGAEFNADEFSHFA